MTNTLEEVLSHQKLCKVTGEATVAHAAKLMTFRNVGAVPVVDGERVIGILTERDVLTRVVAHGWDPEVTAVSQVMTPGPRCVQVGDTLADALRLMQEIHCRHLPVIAEGRLVGIVALRDLVFRLLEKKDAEIQGWKEFVEYLPPDAGIGGD